MARIPPERLRLVEDLLSQGKPTSGVVASCISEFGISERQAWRYVQKVYEAWAKADEVSRASTRARRVRFLERIAHDAFVDREYSAAIAATRQLCRIEGLEQMAVKLQHDGDSHDNKPFDVKRMTSNEKRKMLAELLAKASAAHAAASANAPA